MIYNDLYLLEAYNCPKEFRKNEKHGSQIKKRYFLGASCTFMKPPVDECSDNTHNCPQHSSCEDTLEGFHCKADSGFACIDDTGACKDLTLWSGL